MSIRSITFAFLVTCGVAFGDPAISANDIEWDGQNESPVVTVSIFDEEMPAETLLGWQLELIVRSVPGSTGTVEFASGSEPTEYLLEGQSGGLFETIDNLATDPTIQAFDDDPTLAGVVVPLTPIGLLDLTFTASMDAFGSFELVAVPGQFTTQWSDDQFQDREFANVPFSGSEVVLATISIPEPSSTALVFLGLGGLGLLVRHRRVVR